jgi:inorganic pyrophosphatase/exopolyphosphatase
MNLLKRAKTGITNIKKNFTLGSHTAKLMLRNTRYLKQGDSLVAVKTRRLVRESTIPKPVKRIMEEKLTDIIDHHLAAGKLWIDFRESVVAKEKKEGKKFTKKEIEQLWHQWSKDQDGY